MPTHPAHGNDSRLSFWRRVREYAVPPSMIEAASARRLAGDWAGACAAANVEVGFRLRDVARVHGRELAGRLRDDLRRLAPDLLRWHLPRTAPDGLLRPGLTVPLARYPGEPQVVLVVRTPPAWAEYGQRIALALWDGSEDDGRSPHPHPHPSRRFRHDLHRHLWDAGRSTELAVRAGSGGPPTGAPGNGLGDPPPHCAVDRCAVDRWAVDRWAAEAELLLRADGRPAGPVVVRLGRRRRLLLGPDGSTAEASGDTSALPLLPDAATWVPPDLGLLRSGAIQPDGLHPLVAAALAPGHRTRTQESSRPWPQRLVDCRGARHRIGLVDGVLAPLDHDTAELRREELLAALSGTPLPCLRAVDLTHRRPHELAGVRERLDHGDTAGALALVEALLGPEAVLREGPLRDELAAAAERRIAYGLYRSGLTGPGIVTHRSPRATRGTRPDGTALRPHHATYRARPRLASLR
ncbi:hypothetical protein [Streptomyces sp. CBMA156]|uniref:hypothetical protein n=1 Tax=Streptomyces sp. CBMA156 TaxID=1930280 RepID=UPI0016619655|nr:hypothetical protein [Streptomyces sp. CBMA156]MBD0672768.1 hypothetical protein [Streptomyces sp. CBMA156]